MYIQQITVSHFGEHKRLHLESSKQNYYIISLRAIIKAIFTSQTHKFGAENEFACGVSREGEGGRDGVEGVM